MSGILSPFGKSGFVTDVRGLTLRAYCRITSNTPSSSAFDRSYNVASIGYDSTQLLIYFIEPIISPKSMTVHYSWSTGSNRYVLLAGNDTGIKESVSIGYRKITNTGMTAVDSGILVGASVGIFGGIGS